MERFHPRRILAAIDFSEGSLAAWHQAEELARRFDARLEALHVEPWQYSVAGLGPIDRPYPASVAEESLEALRERLGEDANIVSLPGDPAETIVSHAVDGRFDLIVMSTHGRTGLSRLVLGSIAESVVHRSPVPVLVTRRVIREIDSVLAPVHFLPYSQAGLIVAARFALELGASLKLLHVVSPPDVPDSQALEGIDRLLGRMVMSLPEDLRRAVRPSRHVAFGNPAREIVAEAERHGLVVMVAHVRRLFKDAVMGTTAERVLRHSRTPVLTVPSSATARPSREVFERQGLRAPRSAEGLGYF